MILVEFLIKMIRRGVQESNITCYEELLTALRRTVYALAVSPVLLRTSADEPDCSPHLLFRYSTPPVLILEGTSTDPAEERRQILKLECALLQYKTTDEVKSCIEDGISLITQQRLRNIDTAPGAIVRAVSKTLSETTAQIIAKFETRSRECLAVLPLVSRNCVIIEKSNLKPCFRPEWDLPKYFHDGSEVVDLDSAYAPESPYLNITPTIQRVIDSSSNVAITSPITTCPGCNKKFVFKSVNDRIEAETLMRSKKSFISCQTVLDMESSVRFLRTGNKQVPTKYRLVEGAKAYLDLSKMGDAQAKSTKTNLEMKRPGDLEDHAQFTTAPENREMDVSAKNSDSDEEKLNNMKHTGQLATADGEEPNLSESAEDSLIPPGGDLDSNHPLVPGVLIEKVMLPKRDSVTKIEAEACITSSARPHLDQVHICRCMKKSITTTPVTPKKGRRIIGFVLRKYVTEKMDYVTTSLVYKDVSLVYVFSEPPTPPTEQRELKPNESYICEIRHLLPLFVYDHSKIVDVSQQSWSKTDYIDRMFEQGAILETQKQTQTAAKLVTESSARQKTTLSCDCRFIEDAKWVTLWIIAFAVRVTVRPFGLPPIESYSPIVHQTCRHESTSPTCNEFDDWVAASIATIKQWFMCFRDVRRAFTYNLKSNRPIWAGNPKWPSHWNVFDKNLGFLYETEIYGFERGPRGFFNIDEAVMTNKIQIEGGIRNSEYIIANRVDEPCTYRVFNRTSEGSTSSDYAAISDLYRSTTSSYEKRRSQTMAMANRPPHDQPLPNYLHSPLYPDTVSLDALRGLCNVHVDDKQSIGDPPIEQEIDARMSRIFEFDKRWVNSPGQLFKGAMYRKLPFLPEGPKAECISNSSIDKKVPFGYTIDMHHKQRKLEYLSLDFEYERLLSKLSSEYEKIETEDEKRTRTQSKMIKQESTRALRSRKKIKATLSDLYAGTILLHDADFSKFKSVMAAAGYTARCSPLTIADYHICSRTSRPKYGVEKVLNKFVTRLRTEKIETHFRPIPDEFRLMRNVTPPMAIWTECDAGGKWRLSGVWSFLILRVDYDRIVSGTQRDETTIWCHTLTYRCLSFSEAKSANHEFIEKEVEGLVGCQKQIDADSESSHLHESTTAQFALNITIALVIRLNSKFGENLPRALGTDSYSTVRRLHRCNGGVGTKEEAYLPIAILSQSIIQGVIVIVHIRDEFLVTDVMTKHSSEIEADKMKRARNALQGHLAIATSSKKDLSSKKSSLTKNIASTVKNSRKKTHISESFNAMTKINKLATTISANPILREDPLNPWRFAPKIVNLKKEFSKSTSADQTSSDSDFYRFLRGRKKSPSNLYVGRPSIFGNPFKIGVDGDRNLCMEKFEKHARASEKILQNICSLGNRTLGCFCAPERCHAEVLRSMWWEARSNCEDRTIAKRSIKRDNNYDEHISREAVKMECADQLLSSASSKNEITSVSNLNWTK